MLPKTDSRDIIDDLMGLAFEEYLNAKHKENFIVHCHCDEPEFQKVSYYFRNYSKMPFIEKIALQNCFGEILDLGAGAGAHSSYLQKNNQNVTAFEISKKACQVMINRGVKKVINGDFFSHPMPKSYDTILMLMNGFGICQNLNKLDELLKKLSSILTDNGQIIFDSTDLSLELEPNQKNEYSGQVSYQMEYQGKLGQPFNWLFLDPELIFKKSKKLGFAMEILVEEENGSFLGRLFKAT